MSINKHSPAGAVEHHDLTGKLSDRVREAVGERRGAMLELLRRLVAIESPSLQPATIAPIFGLLRTGLEDAGFVCRHRSGSSSAGVLLARPRDRVRGRPRQLLLGHCDTVWPVGTLAKMPVRLDEGRLTGPGVYDMKAGLVQTIFALQVLHDLGLRPALSPVVLFSSDEEVGSGESERHIVALARIVDRALVMEPSLTPAGKLKTARKGVARYRLRVTGRAAHAGLNPDQGVSAILELAIQVQALFALNDRARGVSVNVGTIEGGTRANVIAPHASAVIDVRIPTREDAGRVDVAIRALRPANPDSVIAVEAIDYREPMEFTPASRRLWRRAQHIASELGFDLDHGTAGGASDGNITARFVPTLDGLGAVGDGAHAAHEYVEIAPLLERTALLAMLILQPTDAGLSEESA